MTPATLGRCAERIFGSRVTSWQCNRPAGHGPGGRYCKVHARAHDTKGAELTLWCVEVLYGDVTPKPIKVREIMPSSFIDERGRKNNRMTQYALHFDTKEQAFAEAIARTERKLERATAEVAQQETLLAKLKKAAG